MGAEGGDCYGNGTCDEGLSCLSKKCVDPNGKSPVAPGGNFDTDACLGCGEESCASQAEACNGASGCQSLLSCTLACGSNASCLSDCATSVTADDQAAMVAYQSCLVTQCLNECTPEVNVQPTTVQPNTTAQPTTPVQPSTADEVAACFDCGESSCAAEANACSDAGGCGDLLSCAIACGPDANCAANCATTITITADDQAAIGAYQACLLTQCLDECTIDVNVEPVDPAGNPSVTPEPVQPDESGSNSSTEACNVVKPPTSCVAAEAFVLEEDGTDLVGVTSPTYNELVVAGGSVTGDWVLESGQLGVLQFKFSAPIDPARVALEGTLSDVEYVTLEDAAGSGCQYYLSGGRLVRYQKSTDGIVDWYGCWGDYETYETSEPSTLTIVNIRTGVSQLNEAYAIVVTSILL